MWLTWIVIVALLALTGWLTYTVVQLRQRVQAQDATLNQYSQKFQDFMNQKSAQIAAQVDKDIDNIKRAADKRIDAATAQVEQEIKAVASQVDAKLKDVSTAIKKEGEEAATRAKVVLQTQLDDFKTHMKNAYLDEYEKMKTNPPRPKKGPRKRVDAPSRYRSLDDE
jgi:predicted negative regulator of RcsB-dependent stress response